MSKWSMKMCLGFATFAGPCTGRRGMTLTGGLSQMGGRKLPLKN
jgi:hypothetical protein